MKAAKVREWKCDGAVVRLRYCTCFFCFAVRRATGPRRRNQRRRRAKTTVAKAVTKAINPRKA